MIDAVRLKKWLEEELKKKEGLLIKIKYDIVSYDYNRGFYDGFKSVYDAIDWEKYIEGEKHDLF